MRGTVVVGVLVGAAVLAGSPAFADRPEITRQACEAADGTFTREQGVKTCTTTTVGPRTSVVASTPYNQSRSLLGVELYDIDYTGTSQLTETVQTTTIRTQKGNGEVTTQSTTAVLSWTLVRLTCRVAGHYMGVPFDRTVDVDVCENPDDYPVDTLLYL